MRVSQVARGESGELPGADGMLGPVVAQLRRVCAALGAESCGWLTDIDLDESMRLDPPDGLSITRLAGGKTLLAINVEQGSISMSADEMAVVAAYQRAAWTPSLERWPLTAWSKRTAGQVAQTTVCIPLHGPTGTSSTVFIPLGAGSLPWYETALGFVGPLLEAEQELRSVFARSCGSHELLSRQEIESLRWAAKGKTAWESAIIQGIPERTVAQRLRRAREKLGAGSTMLAIGIASQKGLFDHV